MESKPGLVDRTWHRHNCGNDGRFEAGEFQCQVAMIDASRGGFKLRFENVPGAMAVVTPLPCDLIVTNDMGTDYHATVLWAKDGLAGSRFYAHLSLDEVVALMSARFVIKASRPLPQSPDPVS